MNLANVIEKFQVNNIAKAWLLDYKGTCFLLVESSVRLLNATQAVSKIIAQYDITHVFQQEQLVEWVKI